MMNDLTNTNEAQFSEVLAQIQLAKQQAFQHVNKTLVQLYWNIGQYVSNNVDQAGWGKGVVAELADFIQKKEPNMNGFSARNIWRMKQFYEIYAEFPKLSTLWSVLPWSHNRRIMTLKAAEEREFYLKALDKDVKLAHENPSIGVLLCREKDDEVVEYALNRSLSPLGLPTFQKKGNVKQELR